MLFISNIILYNYFTMLAILTGLPKNKEQDFDICKSFSMIEATKVICGSSTMKMYCRELNLTPEIEIVNSVVPTVQYTIPNICLATEGAITLNKCYQILKGSKDTSIEANILANLIKSNFEIHFYIGTAKTDTSLYKQNNIYPRYEIINLIIEHLTSTKVNIHTNFF